MTKLQLQSHIPPILLTSNYLEKPNQANQPMRADLRGRGGSRDFRGLYFSASNTRIRRFFSFLTGFWGVRLIRECVLYAQIYGSLHIYVDCSQYYVDIRLCRYYVGLDCIVDGFLMQVHLH